MAGKTTTTPVSDRGLIRLAGVLLLSGFLINAISTGFHPSGEEDDHEAVFTEYAESADWIAIHIAQFIGVITAVAGLLVLYRALRARGEVPVLGLDRGRGAIATGNDLRPSPSPGRIALKYAVDAWVAAPPAEEQARFADAESLRWLEWGIQSYFRILFGLTIALSAPRSRSRASCLAGSDSWPCSVAALSIAAGSRRRLPRPGERIAGRGHPRLPARDPRLRDRGPGDRHANEKRLVIRRECGAAQPPL